MVCLDCDIIINFLRNNEETVKKIIELQNRGINISTTSISSFEVYRGFVNNKKDSIEKFEKFLSSIDILDFEMISSKKAAEIFEDLKKRGEMLDLADIMIASIVIVNNEKLLTNNLNHFKRINELIIED
jgi:tRNA(fMet)-specific endonuclease VapC